MGRSVDENSVIWIVAYECGEFVELAKEIEKQIKALPSAEPEVLRCKDCKYYRKEKDWHVCDMKVSWCSENQSCCFAKWRRR